MVFVDLRCRSPYSILEGAMAIEDFVETAHTWDMPALALTDTNNMCGALEFAHIARNRHIQPIMGLSLSVALEKNFGNRMRESMHSDRSYPDGMVVLLAQNEIGYQALMSLSSKAFLEIEPSEVAHVKAGILSDHAQGVIALTGGADGILNRLICEERFKEAQAWLERLKDTYPDRLYVELQRHNLKHEIVAEKYLVEWAYQYSLPLVATNEPYFLKPDMYHAHDALLAIAEGSYIQEDRRRKVSPEHYFKSPEKMQALFADVPEAIEQTIQIAQRCAYAASERSPILPRFGQNTKEEAQMLHAQALQGLEKRLQKDSAIVDKKPYFDRLEHELGIINDMGFAGYFLIVADFVSWAKFQHISVGPGRGSGAGSLVAWALTITDLDPINYGLVFERFLNPARLSMPDFDIDFCQERRGEVIRYVQEKYGHDHVAHIITFGSLQPRVVVRDVGRVMQLPLGLVNRIAKLIPANPADPLTLSEAIRDIKELRDIRKREPQVRELFNIALQLEGLYRNASTHAAGVVIGDRPLCELVPLYKDSRSQIPATQFNMKWIEKAGLVKFDFLGLKTLTVIERALKYLAAQNINVDMDGLDMCMPEVYALLSEGFTMGIFQLESSGMRDTLRKMQPDSIAELIALISLFRPGPMENIPEYIERKFGRKKITYLHPELEVVLKETYGIIVYQEQVMQITQVLAGYTMSEADSLRRAMGKKDAEEMAGHEQNFIHQAVTRGVKKPVASEIFKLIDKFAGYGFNKSHAAVYAVTAFRTAYLKTFYPTEFMAASMSLDINTVDKLALFHQENRRMDIKIDPPCVNRSEADFFVQDGRILYALGALKNVGMEAMRHIIDERNRNGLFQSLFDFAQRVDMRLVNKRCFESLASGGAFDALEPNRAKIYLSIDILQSIGLRSLQERQSDQVDLFVQSQTDISEPDLPETAPWSDLQVFANEEKAFGFYFKGHPLNVYQSILDHNKVRSLRTIEACYGARIYEIRVAGLVRSCRERMSRNNTRFAYVLLSDAGGEAEVFVMEHCLSTSREALESGSLVMVDVKLEKRDGEVRLYAKRVQALDDLTRDQVVGLRLYLCNAQTDTLDGLAECLDNIGHRNCDNRGFVELVVPISQDRQARWRLAESIGMDNSVQAAIKATQCVDFLEEIILHI